MRRRCLFAIAKRLLRAKSFFLNRSIGYIGRLTLVPALGEPCDPRRIHVTRSQALLATVLRVAVGAQSAITDAVFVGGGGQQGKVARGDAPGGQTFTVTGV